MSNNPKEKWKKEEEENQELVVIFQQIISKCQEIDDIFTKKGGINDKLFSIEWKLESIKESLKSD